MGKHRTVCFLTDEETEVVKVKEGTNVTLNVQEAKRQDNAQLLWVFGSKTSNMRIVNARQGTVETDYDERFRNRLQLDPQTGALTITQVRVSDSGAYKFQSIGKTILSQFFHLNVYGSISTPSIKFNTSTINTSCTSVKLECCVENSRELVLSWYRGSKRLNKTSSPDLSSRLSVALEVEHHDVDDYRCVAANPVEDKSSKFRPEDTCLRDGETSSWCQTEATVRLVISAVFGLALIVLVVDHIRLRR